MVALGWCLAGLVVLVIGAEFLTRAGTRLAASVGISPIVIGLTVVAVGTSAPELAVGIDAALQGAGSLAVGNIAGTNTFNILFILGISALLLPLHLELRAVFFDLPVMIAAAAAFLIMSWDGLLSRGEGALLLTGALLYTLAIIRDARRERRSVKREFDAEYGRAATANVLRDRASNALLLLAGMAVIVVGAEWLVDGAVALARMLHVSEAFIGLTIVAIGTSSPELVTTIVSTIRAQRDIAIGNLIGSSTYNVLFILGATVLIPAEGIAVEPELIRFDIPVMGLSALACAPVFLCGRYVARWEGALFISAYLAYLAYLILHQG